MAGWWLFESPNSRYKARRGSSFVIITLWELALLLISTGHMTEVLMAKNGRMVF